MKTMTREQLDQIVLPIIFTTVMLFIVVVLSLSGCAPQPKPPVWNMTWSCGSNTYCAVDMGAWNGAGSFSSESDCLAWETGFINSFVNSRVTSCTEN